MEQEAINFTTIIVAIIAGVFGLLGGGLSTGVILWMLNKKKFNAEVLPAEGEGMQKLVERIKGMVKEQVESATREAALETENKAKDVLLAVAAREKQNADNSLERVLVEQGRAEERERQCQSELSHLKDRLAAVEGLAQVNTRLQKDVLLATGAQDERKQREERGT